MTFYLLAYKFETGEVVLAYNVTSESFLGDQSIEKAKRVLPNYVRDDHWSASAVQHWLDVSIHPHLVKVELENLNDINTMLLDDNIYQTKTFQLILHYCKLKKDIVLEEVASVKVI
jgi:hypothetical protein